MGKGENAGNQHFLLFSHCFYPLGKISAIFKKKLKLSSANSFSLEGSKSCRLEKDSIPCGFMEIVLFLMPSRTSAASVTF